MDSRPAASPAPRGLRAALALYARRPVLTMLVLGYSAGLPFYLVYQTLSAWLRQAGIQRSTITMLAWAGFAYSFKFLWSPLVDRMSIPLLTRALGRRRAWMLLAQAGVCVALLQLAASDPRAGVAHVAAWAVCLAFFAATQDIAIDAWRIDSAPVAEQGAMAAAYQLGYRVGLICASSGALLLADRSGWHASYGAMALLVGVGVAGTLVAREPPAGPVASLFAAGAGLGARAGAWFATAVAGPLVDFFRRRGVALALGALLFMGCYRLGDFAAGSMANQLYIDKGYTLTQIGTVVKLYGLLASLVGVVIAGWVVARFGLVPALAGGSVMMALSQLGFLALAHAEAPGLLGLGLLNAWDNLALALHGTALIAFLSGCTSVAFSATQYALFSSLYAIPGKYLEGKSGAIVDAFGYVPFYAYTALLNLPGLLLLAWLAWRGGVQPRAQPGGDA